MNWKRFLVAVFAALLLLPGVSMAQSIVTGAVGGVVTDPSGSVIVGASVTLKTNETGEIQTTNTGSSGTYQFTLLKPGTYVVSATQSGFKQVTESVNVLLGQTSTANLKLELGSGSVTVEVTGQGAMLQTEDANISSNFDTKSDPKHSEPRRRHHLYRTNCAGRDHEQLDGRRLRQLQRVRPAGYLEPLYRQRQRLQ